MNGKEAAVKRKVLILIFFLFWTEQFSLFICKQSLEMINIK